jgi:hypothetical protein
VEDAVWGCDRRAAPVPGLAVARPASLTNRGKPAATALLALWFVVAGCVPIGGPEIVCRDVDQATCQRFAADLLEQARWEQPDKQVVKLTINGPSGAYDMLFSDGTSQAVVGH